MKDNTQQLFTE